MIPIDLALISPNQVSCPNYTHIQYSLYIYIAIVWMQAIHIECVCVCEFLFKYCVFIDKYKIEKVIDFKNSIYSEVLHMHNIMEMV